MEGKTGMNSQQGKNYITEYFMLLKIFHQPFAYDLCGVVFCLRKVSREVFHLNAHVQKQPLCKHHRKKHIRFYANLVFWIITCRQSY